MKISSPSVTAMSTYEEDNTASTVSPTTASSTSTLSPDTGDQMEDTAVCESSTATNQPVASSTTTIYDPPITSAMLKELDCDTLTVSIQIRHDLALEPMLKLRPNSKRRNSGKYTALCKQYWSAMEHEIREFMVSGQKPMRLLRSLSEIRNLMIICYPTSKTVLDGLSAYFEPDLLEHQIMNRSLSLVPLVETLAGILKENCAPRRDALVDRLVDLAREEKYVVMLREFFDVIEIMKLDLANYHMLQLKKLPTAQVIAMEQDFFAKEVKEGRKTVDSTKFWFLGGVGAEADSSAYKQFKQATAATFVHADKAFPDNWFLDQARINTLRNDVQNISISASIYAAIKQLCGKRVCEADWGELKERLNVLIRSSTTTMKQVTDAIRIIISRSEGMTEEQVEKCCESVDKIVRPGSPLFLTINERVMAVIESGLNNLQLDDAIVQVINDKKLSVWQTELLNLLSKLHTMINHHWAVYHPLYEAIYHGKL